MRLLARDGKIERLEYLVVGFARAELVAIAAGLRLAVADDAETA